MLRLVWSNPLLCAACGKAAESENGEPLYSIHRDGFGDGPEVPLCSGCGSSEHPSCEKLWQQIELRGAAR
jgi:hypothetical protein